MDEIRIGWSQQTNNCQVGAVDQPLKDPNLWPYSIGQRWLYPTGNSHLCYQSCFCSSSDAYLNEVKNTSWKSHTEVTMPNPVSLSFRFVVKTRLRTWNQVLCNLRLYYITPNSVSVLIFSVREVKRLVFIYFVILVPRKRDFVQQRFREFWSLPVFLFDH